MTIGKISAFLTRILAASAMSSLMLYGQLSQTTSSITVTATQPETLEASQAIFSITLYTPFGSTLSDATAILANAGITASNLVQLSSSMVPPTTATTTTGQPASTLAWTFQLTTPFTSQKATASALAGIQSSLVHIDTGMSLSFAISSTAAYAGSCDLSSLAANALSQAQTLAAAAGQNLGKVIGLTNQVSTAGLFPCSLTAKYNLGFQYWEAEPLIAINASAAAVSQLDQVSIDLSVNSGPSTALSDVTSALQKAGISGANFVAMNTITNYVTAGDQTSPQTSLTWVFQEMVPLTSLNSALSQLIAAQMAFQNQNPGLNLSFSAVGISASQPATCSETTLLASAKTQAQSVATAAGVKVGPLLNLTTTNNAAAYVVAAQPQGSFSGFGTSSVAFVSTVGVQTTIPVCTMNAQFQLQ